MNRLSQIKPKEIKSPRVLIYGIEGVGKSKFGADAPKSIFISAEGGTNHLANATEMPNIKTFQDVLDGVKELIVSEHDFKTVVLDSADWIERLAHAQILHNTDKTIITVLGGYGSGYRKSESLHKELIEALTELHDKKNMNIVITAHYHVKTVKDPEAAQDYDAFEIKCHEYVSALWREWTDAVLFARFETAVKVDDDKRKGRAYGTDKRIMYTQKRPSFQAKNRFGLPFELDVSWESFQNAINQGGESVDDVLTDIAEFAAKVKDTATKDAVNLSVKSAGKDRAQLAKILNRLKVITKQ